MVPVLLHKYHISGETGTGYWMWLDEFLSTHKLEDLQHKTEISISIPIANVLTKQSVEKIRHDVNTFHQVRTLMKNTELETRRDPNYEYSFRKRGEQVTIGVHSKHPNAHLEHPILHILSLDKQGFQQLQRTIEIGEPSRFRALWRVEGIPAWLANQFPEQEMEVTANPQISEEKLFHKIEFLDKDAKLLYSN